MTLAKEEVIEGQRNLGMIGSHVTVFDSPCNFIE